MAASSLDGRPVVDSWSGWSDPARRIRWSRPTVTPIASISKALAATALLILVDRGLIDPGR